jgi:hypothetical protein
VEESRRGGVEEWRSGGVEEWRSGGVEEWRSYRGLDAHGKIWPEAKIYKSVPSMSAK